MSLLSELAQILGTNEFVFVAFHDSDKSLPSRQLVGTFESCKENLTLLNEKGYGIYFLVNESADNKRTDASITRVRTIFLDDDKGFKGAYPLVPSITVQTSTNKFQQYWLIEKSTLPMVEEWELVQANMDKWGNDPSCKNPARVLRVPGFYNMKLNKENKHKPFLIIEKSAKGVKSVIKYEWPEIVNAFGKIEQRKKTVYTGDSDNYLDEALNKIKTGENFNNSLCTISQHLANKGYSKLLIESLLRGVMNEVENKDQRWKERMQHLPRLIDTAIEKADEVLINTAELDNLIDEYTGIKVELPWPPGLLGSLSESVYKFQHYQNRTLAIVTALGLTAGLVGRKYNISNMGLNLYITVLMDSGRGKDSIQSYISKFYMHFNELGNCFNFLGPKRFTGPKGLYAKIKEQRSMISVFTEAAFMLNSSSGDQAGLTRAMLDIYTKSGNNNYVAAEQYSKTEDSVQPMHSPCLSVINESTAEAYIEYMRRRQLEETGELGRMNIFRITEPKPYENRNTEFYLPVDVEIKFKQLVLECASSAYEEMPTVIEIAKPSEYYQFSDWCVDKEKEFYSENRVQSILYSRMSVKALKLAALCAILKPRGPTDPVVIMDDDWDWAVSTVRTEAENLKELYHHTGSSDVDDILEFVVKPKLIKLFRGGYRGKGQVIKEEYMRKGMFTYAILHQVTRNSSQLKRIQDEKSGMTPLAKVLRHMETVGLIQKVTESEKKVNTLQFRLTREGYDWLKLATVNINELS